MQILFSHCYLFEQISSFKNIGTHWFRLGSKISMIRLSHAEGIVGKDDHEVEAPEFKSETQQISLAISG